MWMNVGRLNSKVFLHGAQRFWKEKSLSNKEHMFGSPWFFFKKLYTTSANSEKL